MTYLPELFGALLAVYVVCLSVLGWLRIRELRRRSRIDWGAR